MKRGIKRTGGGRFDPDVSPIYFFAGNSSNADEPAEYTLIALNDLPGMNDEMERRMDRGDKVFLDSGVFNLANQHAIRNGITMDEALGLHPNDVDGFAKLREMYVDTVRRFEDRLWGYVELDQGGMERKRETRASLEAEGVTPIPVYHPLNDGWDYFDELASQYDRICLGNIVQANQDVRRRIMAAVWERKRAYPHLWIHVLGMAPNEVSGSLVFESCDSSSMVYSVRFGAQAAPFGTSAGRLLARADSTFSVDDAPQQRDGANQLVHTATEHLSRNWRTQTLEQERAFGVSRNPKIDKREAPLR